MSKVDFKKDEVADVPDDVGSEMIDLKYATEFVEKEEPKEEVKEDIEKEVEPVKKSSTKSGKKRSTKKKK